MEEPARQEFDSDIIESSQIVVANANSSKIDNEPRDVGIQCDLDLEELAYRKKKADEMKEALRAAQQAQKEAEQKWEHREHVDELAAMYRKKTYDGLTEKLATLRDEVSKLIKAKTQLTNERNSAVFDRDSMKIELAKAKEELANLRKEVDKSTDSSTPKPGSSKVADNRPNYFYGYGNDPRPVHEQYSKEDWDDYLQRKRQRIANPSPDEEMKAWKLGGKNWRKNISRFVKVPLPDKKLPLPENYKVQSDKERKIINGEK